VALAQEPADLILGLAHVTRQGRTLTEIELTRAGVGLAHAEHLLLRRRERDQDDVVLILPPRVLSLARENLPITP